MKRRTFLKDSTFTVFSVAAFGAINWNGKKFVGDNVTTTDILGPFYRPGAPMRNNIIPHGSGGELLNLKGIIYKENGKSPLENALIEIWQCDENQHYDNTSDEYRFRGAVRTGRNGAYEFKTIVPVPYKANPDNEASWRPAHIHIRVSSVNQQDLITQVYFKGDPYLSSDRSSSAPASLNRILSISKNANGENELIFDIVMTKEFPLDAAVYKRIEGLYQVDQEVVEFSRNDDLLFMKRNGQIVAGLTYVGNNSFEGGIGFPKVTFELLKDGATKVTVTARTNTYSGVKYLKYGH